MQCQALSNTHWQTLTVCGQSPLSQNQCSSRHSKGAQCVHCLRCLIHTAACLCSTRTCDGRWERGALCTTARLEMTQRHKAGRLHKQRGRERESLKKTEVKESHVRVWRQRTQGYRNRHDWKLWSNKTIAGRERREGNEEMRGHMFGIDSQSLAYREWVTDRIRAAKLKERKEGQGKVRNQRREISRYKKIGDVTQAGGESPECWGCDAGLGRGRQGLSVSDFLSPLSVSSSLTPAVHLFFLSPPPQCSMALFTSISACVAVLGHQFYLQITWFVIHWYSLVFQNFSYETCTILSPSNAGTVYVQIPGTTIQFIPYS